MGRILVVGSMNMDIVTRVKKHPLPGETIHGRETSFFSGGKGANQAVSAARSGAQVMMAGAVGNDFFGREIRRLLEQDGIDLTYLSAKPQTTGTAVITIDENGENSIVLAEGANGALRNTDIERITFSEFDAVLLQNEIPSETNAFVIDTLAASPVQVYYNPAPARKVDERTLAKLDCLIVNEIEAGELAGMQVIDKETADQAAKTLIGLGVKSVITTLGRKGACYFDQGGQNIFVPAYKVDAVDTTGAGDTFIGAFAAKAVSGCGPKESLTFASAAAALAVMTKGAQNAIPTAEQTESFISSRN